MLRTPQGQAALADDYVEQIRRAAKEDGGLLPLWIKRKGRKPDSGEAAALVMASAAIATGRDEPLLHPDTTALLNHMLELVMHSEFGERLRDEAKWNMLSSNPDAFVLGDHPVTYAGAHNSAWPIWRQELPSQITVPLHPEMSLEIRATERVDPLTFDEIDQINLRAWHWSNRCLIARSPEPLLRLRELAASTACHDPLPSTTSAPRKR